MDASQKETPTEKDGPDNQAKKKGLALIVHDLKQKRLIPIKIIFFFIVSGKWTIPESDGRNSYIVGVDILSQVLEYSFRTWPFT